MRYTRRNALALGASGTAALWLGSSAARAQAGLVGDSYETEGGPVVIYPVEHASFVMATPGLVIYNDPVGGAEAYAGLPPAGLILISHEHSDHFDAPTLAGIATENTRLLTNPAVHGMLPAELQAKATGIGNGETTTANGIAIDAIPAYNTTADRLQYHPQGRDNGYVLTIGGTRFYIAGDTEDIPEMRALEGIDVAFLPMVLPYTMDIEQAASAVGAFAPGRVYPYHYGESDIDAFVRLVGEFGAPTEVVRHDWYAGS